VSIFLTSYIINVIITDGEINLNAISRLIGEHFIDSIRISPNKGMSG